MIIIGCGQKKYLPDLSEVISIEADYRLEDGGDIIKFNIITNDYSEIVSLANNGKRILFAMKWQYTGGIIINCKTTTPTYISFFLTDDSKGAFKINDTYFRGKKNYEIYQNLLSWYSNSLININNEITNQNIIGK